MDQYRVLCWLPPHHRDHRYLYRNRKGQEIESIKELDSSIPDNSNEPYDIRDVINLIFDERLKALDKILLLNEDVSRYELKEKIREELNDYAEVQMPYDFPKGCHIKYITLLNDEELFSSGGKFCNICNDYLVLKNKGSSWRVPIYIRQKCGKIIYETKLFIPEKFLKIFFIYSLIFFSWGIFFISFVPLKTILFFLYNIFCLLKFIIWAFLLCGTIFAL